MLNNKLLFVFLLTLKYLISSCTQDPVKSVPQVGYRFGLSCYLRMAIDEEANCNPSSISQLAKVLCGSPNRKPTVAGCNTCFRK